MSPSKLIGICVFNHCVYLVTPLITHRKGGALPDGVSGVRDKLIFGRPLRLNDSGLYECVVNNELGVGKTKYLMTISGEFM